MTECDHEWKYSSKKSWKWCDKCHEMWLNVKACNGIIVKKNAENEQREVNRRPK